LLANSGEQSRTGHIRPLVILKSEGNPGGAVSARLLRFPLLNDLCTVYRKKGVVWGAVAVGLNLGLEMERVKSVSEQVITSSAIQRSDEWFLKDNNSSTFVNDGVFVFFIVSKSIFAVRYQLVSEEILR